MVLGGLQKLTLLDFPGRVACTVFTKGCNFRCPFCHNAALVTDPDAAVYPVEDFLAFLRTRQGLLDGVAITGGEPLLHRDMGDLLARIKELGFAVKLDTNGAFPQVLAPLLSAGLVDYVAMDIKNTPEKYPLTCGCAVEVEAVKESVSLLLRGSTDFEFRTTAVAELHTPEDFGEMGRWIAGAPRYFIQQFKDSGGLIADGCTAPDKETMEQYLQAARVWVPDAQLRGIS